MEKPPKYFHLAIGAGEADTELNSLDRALQDAGLGDFNLVKVSSILPPGSEPGNICDIQPGSIVHTAYAVKHSSNPAERISVAVAVAIPKDTKCVGVIMEKAGIGDAKELEAETRKMAEIAVKDRGIEEFTIESVSIEHCVYRHVSIIAAVVIW